MQHAWRRLKIYTPVSRKPEGKRPRGRTGVGGRIILKWYLKIECRRIDLAQDGGLGAGLCEHGNNLRVL
jgi:hypothetical protein